MNLDSEAAIIINDLDSLAHRIEALQANIHYTEAVCLVHSARRAMIAGRMDIHQSAMQERFKRLGPP